MQNVMILYTYTYHILCVCAATIKPRVMLTSTITFILLSCRRITNCRTSSWPLLRQAYVNFSNSPKKILPPPKKNAQKMNRSKRFQGSILGLLRLFTIYIYIGVSIRGYWIFHRGFRARDSPKSPHVLGAIGWIHLGEILCPIAMVAMRHLIHHWRQDDAVHPKLLSDTVCSEKGSPPFNSNQALFESCWSKNDNEILALKGTEEKERINMCVYMLLAQIWCLGTQQSRAKHHAIPRPIGPILQITHFLHEARQVAAAVFIPRYDDRLRTKTMGTKPLAIMNLLAPQKNVWWEVTHHNFRCRVFLEEWKKCECGMLYHVAFFVLGLSQESRRNIPGCLRNSDTEFGELCGIQFIYCPCWFINWSCWQVAVFHSVVGEAWQSDRSGSGTWPPGPAKTAEKWSWRC